MPRRSPALPALAAGALALMFALNTTASAAECLVAPREAAPAGQHWFFRTDKATQQKCWYLRERDVETTGSPQAQQSARSDAAAQDQPAASPAAQQERAGGAVSGLPALAKAARRRPVGSAERTDLLELSRSGACPCRRTGVHFAGTCAGGCTQRKAAKAEPSVDLNGTSRRCFPADATAAVVYTGTVSRGEDRPDENVRHRRNADCVVVGVRFCATTRAEDDAIRRAKAVGRRDRQSLSKSGQEHGGAICPRVQRPVESCQAAERRQRQALE